MKYLIIYHKEDNDGVFSGALFLDYLTNKLNVSMDDIDLIPADYINLSDLSNNVTVNELAERYKTIIMTDISFNNTKFMKELYKKFGHKFIWCDHHKPIIDESFKSHFDDAPGIRDTQRSAILNVWKFLYDPFDEAYNEKKVPELLRILSAYDSWSYEREGYDFDYVRDINKATTIEYNLELDKVCEVINSLVDVYVNNVTGDIMSVMSKDIPLIKRLHETGKKLNEYDDIVNKGIIETSGDTSWVLEDYDKDLDETIIRKCCAIFHQGATNSIIFKSLRNSDVENGIVFKHNKNATWTISLYNVNDEDWFHCGEFLKFKYNGGGHKGAAGCQITQEQFIEILKNKVI